MSRWICLSTPCLACLIFLAANALSRQLPPSPAAPLDPFVAQPTELPAGRLPGNPTGDQLLDQLLGALCEIQWLKLTIWQRLHDADESYVAEAKLNLGPDGCARLHTIVRAGAISCQTLVVSDGHVLAEVVRHPGAPDQVASGFLPDRKLAGAREQWLRKRGCAGPHALLAEIRSHVPAWRVDSGVWREGAVLRLEGALDHKHPLFAAAAGPPVRSCRLYLDAATLWPLRLEWWTGPVAGAGRLHLELEYRDPVVNRPLGPAECARVFTYQTDAVISH